MKIQPECISCHINRVIFEARQVNKDLLNDSVKMALKILAEQYSEDAVSVDISTALHKEIYKILGDDPFLDLKNRSNEIALKLLPNIRKLIENSDNKFRSSILVSIIGNVMDYGLEGGYSSPELLTNQFEKEFKLGLGHDDSDILKQILKKSKSVLYIGDNCGEIIFDIPLLEILKDMGLKVTYMVRGEPILNDVTMSDAKYIENIVDEIITTKTFAVGVVPDLVKEEIKAHDVLIAKGMANYEALTETDYSPLAYLLRIKCDVVARSLNVKKGMNVVKVV